jgi:hypothetical protein
LRFVEYRIHWLLVDGDPPTVLAIGPDSSANVLGVIFLDRPAIGCR